MPEDIPDSWDVDANTPQARHGESHTQRYGAMFLTPLGRLAGKTAEDLKPWLAT